MIDLPAGSDTLPPGPAHIHIVGIGGAGMSPIARVLLDRGYRISGSDRGVNAATDALARDGATIFIGHAAEQIGDAASVLISSAVRDDNPEVSAARVAGISVLKRRDALGAITAGYDVIAVAGTHGKTTTTALIVHLLSAGGYDPTYIIGGTLLSTGTNAAVGTSKWFVIEADEYDHMFLGLHPKIALITNIEHDHPDMFPTLADVQAAFRAFAANVRSNGVLIACADDQYAASLAAECAHAGKSVQRYDLASAPADLLAALPPTLAGRHNQLNAIGAATALMAAGIPLTAIIAHIGTFSGTARRMEMLGVANGVTIYSDYGHHPTAIRATLEGARIRFGSATIWAVWQPHTYSRTHLLAHEFAESFADADHALIMDIFAAREQPMPGLGSPEIAEMARATGHPDARHSGDLSATADILRRETQPGAIVIIFSAGDAPKIGEIMLRGES